MANQRPTKSSDLIPQEPGTTAGRHAQGDKDGRRRAAPTRPIVPNKDSIAHLHEVREAILMKKHRVATDSGETLRLLRSGDNVTVLPARHQLGRHRG